MWTSRLFQGDYVFLRTKISFRRQLDNFQQSSCQAIPIWLKKRRKRRNDVHIFALLLMIIFKNHIIHANFFKNFLWKRYKSIFSSSLSSLVLIFYYLLFFAKKYSSCAAPLLGKMKFPCLVCLLKSNYFFAD